MRTLFLIIVFLHGLIHFLGFVKGFGLRELKGLKLPISRKAGISWLIAGLIIIIYGIFHFANFNRDWLIGFPAVIISQTLVIMFWKDSKFGTLPNILILVALLISLGNYHFQKTVQEETNRILSGVEISKEKILTENEAGGLPEPIKKWLNRSGAIGKPYITAGKVVQKAEMQMKKDDDKWNEAEASQYTTIDSPAFIWTVEMKYNSFLNFQGRDKFENGEGNILIKLNSLFNIVNEKGEKINEGTIQRYIGEMVWFPSLAMSPYIRWQGIDDKTAIATMEYKGSKGSGTFYFNSEGDFIKYSAMRYKDNTPDSKRYEWVLTVENYNTFEGIKAPSKMTATWKLDDGDWTWLKLEIKDIRYNRNAIN